MGYWVMLPAVTPDPKPTSATLGGVSFGYNNNGKRPTPICVGMSPPLDASTLPLFLRENPSFH